MLYHQVYMNNESNEWLVLLHGLGGNSKIWYKQKRELTDKFNVIFVDLHGHGNSKWAISEFKNHTFKEIANDVVKILDANGIDKAAFMGVSLGTAVARAITLVAPERVHFLVLAGAIVKFNLRSSLLIHLGHALKGIMPYMNLYKLFAWIMMPKQNHKSSRLIFVREAAKLGQEEFLFWFGLSKQLGVLYSQLKLKNLSIPTKYIMGSEDHMFIEAARQEASFCSKALITIIGKSGHLCNLEKAKEFNSVAVQYIETQFKTLRGEALSFSKE
ncbi:alpha/beta fold hydrolase [Mesobacillus harenae]|uniref:alpha/beta fold hydrolase n=1 Tax=Mesobacillus harenae TaxID=2213203 RepID=UPI0015806C32|nr:alpha/beta hydrolase [Mesobacillus harenae]